LAQGVPAGSAGILGERSGSLAQADLAAVWVADAVAVWGLASAGAWASAAIGASAIEETSRVVMSFMVPCYFVEEVRGSWFAVRGGCEGRSDGS